MTRQVWKPAEIELLRKLYPDTPTALIAFGMRRTIGKVYQAAARLGLHKSAAYMASPEAYSLRQGRGIGVAQRFKPGQAPANKGLRRPGYAPGRMASTQFKPGCRNGVAAQLHKPVGTVLADMQGYVRIKVRERVKGDKGGWDRNVWPLLHWRTWEQHHGPVPPGHKVVFKDGDRAHCEIGNLELLTDAEMMRRNSVHNLPMELQQVIHLNGVLKRKLRRLSQ